MTRSTDSLCNVLRLISCYVTPISCFCLWRYCFKKCIACVVTNILLLFILLRFGVWLACWEAVQISPAPWIITMRIQYEKWKENEQTKKPCFREKAGRTDSMHRTQDGTPEPVWMSRTHSVPSTPPHPTPTRPLPPQPRLPESVSSECQITVPGTKPSPLLQHGDLLPISCLISNMVPPGAFPHSCLLLVSRDCLPWTGRGWRGPVQSMLFNLDQILVDRVPGVKIDQFGLSSTPLFFFVWGSPIYFYLTHPPAPCHPPATPLHIHTHTHTLSQTHTHTHTHTHWQHPCLKPGYIPISWSPTQALAVQSDRELQQLINYTSCITQHVDSQRTHGFIHFLQHPTRGFTKNTASYTSRITQHQTHTTCSFTQHNLTSDEFHNAGEWRMESKMFVVTKGKPHAVQFAWTWILSTLQYRHKHFWSAQNNNEKLPRGA